MWAKLVWRTSWWPCARAPCSSRVPSATEAPSPRSAARATRRVAGLTGSDRTFASEARVTPTTPTAEESLDARYLVTGAEGCIGSWALKNLVEADTRVVAFDRDDRHRRP